MRISAGFWAEKENWISMITVIWPILSLCVCVISAANHTRCVVCFYHSTRNYLSLLVCAGGCGDDAVVIASNHCIFSICFSIFSQRIFILFPMESPTLTVIYFHRWKNFFWWMFFPLWLLLHLSLFLCGTELSLAGSHFWLFTFVISQC